MILTEVIMMSRNSMVSSSWLRLPSTRSLTTKTHELNVFRHVENIKETLMIEFDLLSLSYLVHFERRYSNPLEKDLISFQERCVYYLNFKPGYY